MFIGRDCFYLLLFTGIAIGDSSKAEKEVSGSKLSTCPIVCPACAVDHLQAFTQVDVPRDQMTGCSSKGVLEKIRSSDTDATQYVERHIIHVKNNEPQTVYLSLVENGTASNLPPHPSSIITQRRYIFALTSTAPTKWVINQNPHPSTRHRFFLCGGGSAVSYRSGRKIDATYFDNVESYWKTIQLIDVVQVDWFQSTHTTSFTQMKAANFIQLYLGENNYNTGLSCLPNPESLPSANIAASYLTQRVGLGCTSEPENLAKVPHLVYAVNVNNSRATTSLVVQLEEISVLTENQKLTLILRSKNPVEWKIISDFANPIYTQLEFVIERRSRVNTTDLSFAEGASYVAHNFTRLTKRGIRLIEAAASVYKKINGFADFGSNVNFIKIKVTPKASNIIEALPSELLIINEGYSQYCTDKEMTLYWSYLKVDINLAVEKMHSAGCHLYESDRPGEMMLRAKVGECGLFLNSHGQLQIRVMYRISKEVDGEIMHTEEQSLNLTCIPIPKIKMQAYLDYEQSQPQEFPLNIQDSESKHVFIEMSVIRRNAENANLGVHLKRCQIIQDPPPQKGSKSIELVSGNCPANQSVSFMVPFENMRKQIFTFPLSLLKRVSVANTSVQCCAFLCDSNRFMSNNDYPKCIAEHGMNCGNNQLSIGDWNCEDYKLGPFIQVSAPKITPVKTIESNKEMRIELKYALGISFAMFFIGVLLVFVLCRIQQHYKRVPQREATEQDQFLLNKQASYIRTSSQSASAESMRHVHIVQVVNKGEREESESPLLGTYPLEHTNGGELPNLRTTQRGHVEDTSSADSGVPVEADKSESSSVTSQTAAEAFVSNLAEMKEERV